MEIEKQQNGAPSYVEWKPYDRDAQTDKSEVGTVI